MRLSANPDLGRPRALVLSALAVSLIVWGLLAMQKGHITASLGDTDDATRMVLVRGLLAGAGWYDQFLARVQPPLGGYMHWSRLIDGGLAGLIWLFRLGLSPARAELAARFVWPLIWILPAVAFALAIARALGERAAALATAIAILFTLRLFVQFLPGRVDHHNLQITLALGAIAGALQGGRRGAAAAGIASGLGLAIGLEALAFHALVGVSFALRLARRREEGPAAVAYGAALAAATALLFLAQTPPWRWTLSVCDAIGLNLSLAVLVAGGGLALAGALAVRAPAAARIGLIALAGLAGAALYLALDPACIHGPFAGLDPRVRPFWFDRIQEIQGWATTLKSDRAGVVRQASAAVLALAGWAILATRPGKWRDDHHLLVLAVIVAATAATISARRMEAYLFWFSVPVIGAAVSVAARRWLRDRLLPTLVLAVLASPSAAAGAANLALDKAIPAGPRRPAPATGRCFLTGAYARLARLPPGLVVSETDLGPFILAATPDSTLAAPYHRFWPGVLAAHQILAAPPERAESLARAAHALYIVDCPPYPMMAPRGSFGDRLRKGAAPSWLEPLSGPRDILKIYRLSPDKGRP
jgi:hypothetical protein